MSLTITDVGNYVFTYAYPVAFSGAVLYATTQFIGLDLATVMNHTLATWLSVFIGVCGVVSMFTWFNQDVPFLTNNVYGRGAIKTSSTM